MAHPGHEELRPVTFRGRPSIPTPPPVPPASAGTPATKGLLPALFSQFLSLVQPTPRMQSMGARWEALDPRPNPNLQKILFGSPGQPPTPAFPGGAVPGPQPGPGGVLGGAVAGPQPGPFGAAGGAVAGPQPGPGTPFGGLTVGGAVPTPLLPPPQIARTDLNALINSGTTGKVDDRLRKEARDEILSLTDEINRVGADPTGIARLEQRILFIESALADAHQAATNILDQQRALARTKQQIDALRAAAKVLADDEDADAQLIADAKKAAADALATERAGQFQRQEEERLREEAEVTASRRQAGDLLSQLFPDLEISPETLAQGIDPSLLGLLISLAQFREAQKRAQSSAGITSVRFR
jgi:cell division septum initiation protein DivIVA